MSDAQLAARIEIGRMCFDLVADGADPDIWTPATEPIEPAARALYQEQAQAACGGCEVVAECLEWALRRGERHHIFGGTAPWERDELLRSRARVAGEAEPVASVACLLPAITSSVPKARHLTVEAAVAVATETGHRTAQVDTDTVELVVTELATNAVMHGSRATARELHGPSGGRQPQFRLEITAQPAGIEVAVTDKGPGAASGSKRPAMPAMDAESGRGLPLIALLTGGHYDTERLADGTWRVRALVGWRTP